MRKILAITATTVLLITGCATTNGPEYDGTSYQEIKTYEIGTVEGIRKVSISDNGTGTFIGALVGAVVGSTVGQGNGSVLASLAGGLGGAYVGKQAGKSNAQELSVQLDNGENVVVVAKGDKFQIGDKVKIIKDGNKVDQVYKLQ
jgi:outer membrane lipoprotein SlyB